MWTVRLSRKAKRADKRLSKNAYIAFLRLLVNLKDKPEAHNWPNYGKLGRSSYHCHLKKGNPTYVVCWTADKKNKTIEVYYAGTHEKAPY